MAKYPEDAVILVEVADLKRQRAEYDRMKAELVTEQEKFIVLDDRYRKIDKHLGEVLERVKTLEALLSECHFREDNLKRRTEHMLLGPISALRESGWTAMADELEQYCETLAAAPRKEPA